MTVPPWTLIAVAFGTIIGVFSRANYSVERGINLRRWQIVVCSAHLLDLLTIRTLVVQLTLKSINFALKPIIIIEFHRCPVVYFLVVLRAA